MDADAAEPRSGDGSRTRPIRVALVDDHQFIADLLSRALERQPERFEFVGNAPRLADVGPLLREEPADVVLVDYSLPDGRGSDVLRLVRRHWPRARLVLFSGHSESDILQEAIAAGADGIIAKGTGMDEILDVIERADRGDVLLAPEILRDLMAKPAAGASRLAALDRLTPRERVVLEAMLADRHDRRGRPADRHGAGDPPRPPPPRRPEARRDEPPRDDQPRAPRRAHPRAGERVDAGRQGPGASTRGLESGSIPVPATRTPVCARPSRMNRRTPHDRVHRRPAGPAGRARPGHRGDRPEGHQHRGLQRRRPPAGAAP